MDSLGTSSASSAVTPQSNDLKDSWHRTQLTDRAELLERHVSTVQNRLGAYAESLRQSCQCSNSLLESFLELLRDTPLAQVALASQDAAKSLDESASRAHLQLAKEAGEALHRFSLVLPELKNAFRRSSHIQHESNRRDGDANSNESIDTRQAGHSFGEKGSKELSTDDELKSARELSAKRMELVGAALLSCLHSTGKLWTHGSQLFSPFAKYQHIGQLLRNSKQAAQMKDAIAKWLAFSQSNKALRQCGNLSPNDLHFLVHCDQIDIPAAVHEQLCQSVDSLLQTYKYEYESLHSSRVTVPAGFHLNPKGIELALRGCCSNTEAQAAGVDLYPASRSNFRFEDMVRVPCCIDGHLFEAGSGGEAFDLRVRLLRELIQQAVGDAEPALTRIQGLEQEVLWHACSGVAHVACRVAVQLLFGKAQLVVIKPSRDCQEQIPDITVCGTEVKISVPTTWWIVEDWPLFRVLRNSSRVQVLGVVKAVYRSTINVAAYADGHSAIALPEIDVTKETYHDDGTKFFEYGSVLGGDRSVTAGMLSPPLNEQPNRGLRSSIDRASESIRTAVQAVRDKMKRGETRVSKFYVPAPQSDDKETKADNRGTQKEEVYSPPSIVVTTESGSMTAGHSTGGTFVEESGLGEIASASSVRGILQDSDAFFGYLETKGFSSGNGMVGSEELEEIISLLSYRGTCPSAEQSAGAREMIDPEHKSSSPVIMEPNDGVSTRDNLRSHSETSVEALRRLCANNFVLTTGRNMHPGRVSDSPKTIKIVEELGSVVPAMRAARLGEERDEAATEKESALDEDEEVDEEDGALSEGTPGPRAVKSQQRSDDDEWIFGKKLIGNVSGPFNEEFHPSHTFSDSAEHSGVSGNTSPLTLGNTVLPPARVHDEPSKIWQNSCAVGAIGDRHWKSLPRDLTSQLQPNLRSYSWSTLVDNPGNVAVRSHAVPTGASRDRPRGARDSTDLDLTTVLPSSCPPIDDDAESAQSNGSDSDSSSSSQAHKLRFGNLDQMGQKGTSTWPRTSKEVWAPPCEGDQTWPSELFPPPMASAASHPDVRTQPPVLSAQPRHPSEGQIDKLAQANRRDSDKPPPLPPRSYRTHQQHPAQQPQLHPPGPYQGPPPSSNHGDWSMHPPQQHHPHAHRGHMCPIESHSHQHPQHGGGGPQASPFAAPRPWNGPPNHPHHPPQGHWPPQQGYFGPPRGHPPRPPVHDVPHGMHGPPGPGPMHQPPPRPYPPPMHSRGNYSQMHPEMDQPPPPSGSHGANTPGYDGYGPPGPPGHHPRMMGPGYGQHLHPEEARRPHTWSHNRQYPGPQYDYYQNAPPMQSGPPPIPPRPGQSGHPPPNGPPPNGHPPPSGPPPNGPPPSGPPPNGPPPFAAPRRPPNMADDWGPPDNWSRPEPQIYRYPAPAGVHVSTM